MTLELRPLRHLLAVVEHGSFGRAALALGLTQPSLSRSVQGLERRVGAALFRRSKRGVVPTDEGHLLVVRARALVGAADELDREVQRRKVPGSGQVSIGAGPYPGETVVPAALARFGADHPLVRVRVLLRGDWDELLARLRARELDFVLFETSMYAGEHDLDVEPLSPHPVYLVARRGHPLARRKAIGPAHTFGYPFVALSRFPPRALEPMLATRGETVAAAPGRPFPSIEIGSLAAAKRLLANSDAIAPLTLSCVAEEVARGSLVLLLTEPWMKTGYGFLSLKDRVPSAAARALIGCLREEEATLLREEAALAAVVPRVTPGRRARPRPRP